MAILKAHNLFKSETLLLAVGHFGHLCGNGLRE